MATLSIQRTCLAFDTANSGLVNLKEKKLHFLFSQKASLLFVCARACVCVCAHAPVPVLAILPAVPKCASCHLFQYCKTINMGTHPIPQGHVNFRRKVGEVRNHTNHVDILPLCISGLGLGTDQEAGANTKAKWYREQPYAIHRRPKERLLL